MGAAVATACPSLTDEAIGPPASLDDALATTGAAAAAEAEAEVRKPVFRGEDGGRVDEAEGSAAGGVGGDRTGLIVGALAVAAGAARSATLSSAALAEVGTLSGGLCGGANGTVAMASA